MEEDESFDMKKGRRKGGGGGGLPRKWRINDNHSVILDSLRSSESGIPESIYNFVSDLIQSGSVGDFPADDAFAYLEDVHTELTHFVDQPGTYLYDPEPSQYGRLKFRTHVYRHQE